LESFENEYVRTFNQLVLANQPRIYRLFRRMVDSHEEANDLTQDTFIKVYRNLSKFRGSSSIDTWIYRIAINTGLNYLRRQRARQILGLDLVERRVSDDEQPANPATSNILRRAIAKLPARQQMVVILRSYQELPFKEIAAILNMTENNAKVNYSHALKSLRRILNKMGVDYAAL
jgi:RNA polymerase sigma-70 factor (ECF subfamily)